MEEVKWISTMILFLLNHCSSEWTTDDKENKGIVQNQFMQHPQKLNSSENKKNYENYYKPETPSIILNIRQIMTTTANSFVTTAPLDAMTVTPSMTSSLISIATSAMPSIPKTANDIAKLLGLSPDSTCTIEGAQGICVNKSKYLECAQIQARINSGNNCGDEMFCCYPFLDDKCGNEKPGCSYFVHFIKYDEDKQLGVPITKKIIFTASCPGYDVSPEYLVKQHGTGDTFSVSRVERLENGMLIFLNQPMNDDKTCYACLPTQTRQPKALDPSLNNQDCQVIYSTAFLLAEQKINVKILPTDVCIMLLRDVPAIAMNPQLFCAISSSGQELCKVPLGSPLICNRNNVIELVGVAKLGVGCGKLNKPLLFVDILGQLPAILTSIQSNSLGVSPVSVYPKIYPQAPVYPDLTALPYPSNYLQVPPYSMQYISQSLSYPSVPNPVNSIPYPSPSPNNPDPYYASYPREKK